MQNFIKGNEWNINSVKYGKPLNQVEVIELSKSVIEITKLRKLTNKLKNSYQEEIYEKKLVLQKKNK